MITKTNPNGEQPQLVFDTLTAAYARTALYPCLQHEIHRATVEGYPVSLCVFDLDYFKSINDTYGHRRGDHILIELVDRFNQLSRTGDLLIRYGGDEFVLVLPNTTKTQALAIAQRLLETVQATPFKGQPPLSLSLSIGVATVPQDASHAEALFELADRRAYQAKRRGRGQVVGDDQSTTLLSDGYHVPRLIERDSALAHFHTFLESLGHNRSGLLGIVGPRGVGRSRLLNEVVHAVRLRGYTVRQIQGAAALRPIRYAALDPDEWPREPSDATETPAEGPAILRGLTQPHQLRLLIAIDNLTELDQASLELLRKLLVEPPVASLVLVYTAETDKALVLLPPSSVDRDVIELQPLSQTGVQIWVRSFLQWDPPRAFLTWLAAETGGLPGLLERGLRWLTKQGFLYRDADHTWALQEHYAEQPLADLLGNKRRSPAVHNLPATLTDFVGREQELHQVLMLLQRSRLVSLIGPGGIGKTRLALAAAREQLHDYSHGVFFVALATIHDPDLVASAIASTLQVKEVAGQTLLTTLQDFVRPKQMLLVLDNFEQVVDGAGLITQLLAEAPQLRVLVTSREVLQVYGEYVFVVPPLGLPDVQHLPPVEALAQYAAVALFTARAQASCYNFALTAENAQAVTELCTRLDGLPLAIELAAARSLQLTPAQMLAQMSSSLNLLDSGPRDLPARQRTLRGAIDWSYTLLSSTEAQLFRRLSVFVGGGSSDSIAAICCDLPQEAEELPVLLGSLLNKSLLRAAEPRTVLLETISEYAWEQVEVAGEAELLHQRHAQYFVGLAIRAEDELRGPEQSHWIAEMEAEHDNLRAALTWLISQRNAEAAAQLAIGISRFWEIHGHLTEGQQWFDKILGLGVALAPLTHAKSLGVIGILSWTQGKFLQATELLRESFAQFQAQGDDRRAANMLNYLANIHAEQGEYAEARQLYEESLALLRALNYQRGVGVALVNLGMLASAQGDNTRAIHLLEESLVLLRQLNDTWLIASALGALGDTLLNQAEHARALELLEESLDLFRQLNARNTIVTTLTSLGWAALRSGSVDQAMRYFKESLTLLQEMGSQTRVADALEGLMSTAIARHDPVRAAQLGGGAAKLRQAAAKPRVPAEQPFYDQTVIAIRAALPAESFTTAWASGEALSLEDLLSYALS